jgi:hypothetical protein
MCECYCRCLIIYDYLLESLLYTIYNNKNPSIIYEIKICEGFERIFILYKIIEVFFLMSFLRKEFKE